MNPTPQNNTNAFGIMSYLINLVNKKANGIEPKAKILQIIKVVSNPKLSPSMPTIKTTREVTLKLMDIYILFIKVGICVCVSWTLAISTGPEDKRNRPKKGNI